DAVYKQANDQVSVPRPTTRRVGGEPLRDQALLEWSAQLLRDVLGEPPVAVGAGVDTGLVRAGGGERRGPAGA
ncbi:MAG TPA: hypothetical protein VGP91_08155, partial [Actinoplanes sp.]|nr:hypothetical protein [Actinoplanes sp.]